MYENNTGIALPAQTVQDTAMDDFRRIMEVNYFGLLNVTQNVLPVLLKNDKQTGQIINISSCISLVAFPFLSGYTATKAALDRISEALYVELSSTNISVQICSPGPSNTEFDASFMSKKDNMSDVYKGLFGNMLQNSAEFRSKMNVPPENVASTIVKMVNREEKDFRVYPPPSINQVIFLNKEFNNNYSQNVKFGLNAVRTPEKK